MTFNTLNFDGKYRKSRKKYLSLTNDLPSFTPPEIQQIFSIYGTSSFDRGFLWIIDPVSRKEDYQLWFDHFFKKEGYINPETAFPFMRTAFGDVFFFEENEFGFISIIAEVSNHLSINGYLNRTLVEKDSLKDTYLYDLFQVALQKFGELESDECYAFLPPLALGGEIDEAHLQKVKLREHLAFLADLLDD
jgi:hypothetical protein